MRVREISEILNGRLLGDDQNVSSIAPLFSAKPCDLSFVIWPKDIRSAKESDAGCIICEPGIAADYAHQFKSSLVVVDDLSSVFHWLKNAKAQGHFSKHENAVRKIAATAIIHPQAVINRAQIGDGVKIGPGVVVHDGVIIGANSKIDAGAVVHENVQIGQRCRIGANTVVGSAAFIPYGVNQAKNLPALCDVTIEDDVEIGALSAVDKGLLQNTLIKNSTLIDNMVHIGHDVVIGQNVIIAAQSGLAGFVTINDLVTIGGQVGITPHVSIGKGARISGKSMVHCDIKPYEIWSGNPSVPHVLYLRAYGKLMNSFRKRRRDREPNH